MLCVVVLCVEVWYNLLSFIINRVGREIRGCHIYNQRVKRGEKANDS